MKDRQRHIRNFCIIAHIDHGKSTLADRMLEFTGSVSAREFQAQMLDNMDLERERGITIKASAVRIKYKADDGGEYTLNLIDTPGHVDFSYEVSKAIAACEGALLLVDASQGVEAQTVANLYLAIEHDLVIIPVINKVDLPSARPAEIKKQINDILGIDSTHALLASAKLGEGTKEILDRIVKSVPPPSGDEDSPLQALIFDSEYDIYRGVVVYVRVMNGRIEQGMNVKMMMTGGEYEVQEVGVFTPKTKKVEALLSGEVGYIMCNIKDAKEISVGDTVTEVRRPAVKPLPGYRKLKPMVYSGIYPATAADFHELRDAMEKLRLSDSSFIYEMETSASFGMGFRCGFLGLLHMEIIQERLAREYDIALIMTTPSVVYKVTLKDGETIEVDNPVNMPGAETYERVEEPFVKAYIMTPASEMGTVLELCESRRGTYISTEYFDEFKAQVIYELPLSEIIVDFYDKLKSATHGYGSLDYELIDYRKAEIVKVDIMINGDLCESFSFLTHKDKAYSKARGIVSALKDNIPRHLFQIPIQAAIGGRIIARETVKSVGKNVTAKCYGGDITRKRKLWEKQKEGKKKMRSFGKVEIPSEAFIAAMKVNG